MTGDLILCGHPAAGDRGGRESRIVDALNKMMCVRYLAHGECTINILGICYRP